MEVKVPLDLQSYVQCKASEEGQLIVLHLNLSFPLQWYAPAKFWLPLPSRFRAFSATKAACAVAPDEPIPHSRVTRFGPKPPQNRRAGFLCYWTTYGAR
jgi:hypothetical protein